MKNIIALILLTFFLTSCWNNKNNEVISNNKEIEKEVNQITKLIKETSLIKEYENYDEIFEDHFKFMTPNLINKTIVLYDENHKATDWLDTNNIIKEKVSQKLEKFQNDINKIKNEEKKFINELINPKWLWTNSKVWWWWKNYNYKDKYILFLYKNAIDKYLNKYNLKNDYKNILHILDKALWKQD